MNIAARYNDPIQGLAILFVRCTERLLCEIALKPLDDVSSAPYTAIEMPDCQQMIQVCLDFFLLFVPSQNVLKGLFL